MKSKIKLILVFGIIVVLLAAAIVVLKITDKTAEEDADTNTASTAEVTSQLLYDKSPYDISTIDITNEAGSYVIERIDANSIQFWTILEMYQAPIDYTIIDSTLSAAATLTSQQVVTDNADDLSIYGLTEPRAKVKTTFTDTQSTVKELYIGNDTPKSGKVYVCFAGENTVYTVNTADVSCFLNDKFYYVTKTVYTAFVSSDENDTNDYSRINKMTIKRADIDYDIVIEYDKRQDNPDIVSGNSSSYIMTSPVTLDLNTEKSSNLMSLMFGLTASSIEVIAPSDIQKEQYGLMTPYAEISMDIAGGDFNLTVGNETPDKSGRYCMAQDINVIYVFSYDMLPWVTVMPLDVTTTLITSNYIFDLTSIEINGMGLTNEVFTMTGSSNDDFVIKLGDKDVDKDKFKTFYQFILKAPAEELYFETPSAPATLTVKITNPDHTDVLSFYQLENRRTAVALNGKVSFSLKTAYVERLVENFNHLINNEDIITNW